MTLRRAQLDRPERFVVAAIFTIPLWWVLGLDQAVWIVAGLAVGGSLLHGAPPRRLSVAAGAFLGLVLLTGVLGAEGVRWLTFAREIIIVAAFLVVLLGTAVRTSASPDAPSPLLAAACAFVVLSSAVSLFAFALQTPLRFETVIAPLVPPVIADTGLGATSLTQRSIAEESFFLGTRFLRPQGFFLFSTSQAVAQAVLLPVLLAAAAWYPRLRWPFYVGALVTAAALLVSTTRMPVIALAAAAILVWIIRGYQRGELTISVPLRGPKLGITFGVMVLFVGVMYASGLMDSVVNVLTTRSLEGRSALYERTLDGFWQRPLGGWGTERDWTPTPTPPATPTLTPSPTPTPTPAPSEPEEPAELPPLGSHSQYLGILFKQGIVGFVAFAVLVALVVMGTWTLLMRRFPASDLIAVSIVASLLAGLTESLWLDPATAVLVAMVWGTAVTGRLGGPARGAPGVG